MRLNFMDNQQYDYFFGMMEKVNFIVLLYNMHI